VAVASGVAGADVRAGPVPRAFTADTLNEYAVPGRRPVTVTDVVPALTVRVVPPGLVVIV
jgi:hypothetical protein